MNRTPVGRLLEVLTIGGITLFAVLAYAAWSAGLKPGQPGVSRFIGPTADRTRVFAHAEMRTALASINDASRSPTERMEDFRDGLKSADALLSSVLQTSPLDAMAIARVGAIRWELGTLEGTSVRNTSSLLEIALQRAGSSTDEAIELADLSLRMGQDDTALKILGRCVESAPDSAPRAIEVLRDAGLDLDRIVAALPASPDVRVALFASFSDAKRLPEYFVMLSNSYPSTSAKEIAILGTTASRLARYADLKELLDNSGAFRDEAVEAERLAQLSLCEAYLHNPGSALAHSERARQLRPDDPRYAEIAANAARIAGSLDDAERLARQALALWASAPNGTAARGRVYRLLGTILDARGRTDEAYDAYRRALALDPTDPWATKRVAEIERLSAPR